MSAAASPCWPVWWAGPAAVSANTAQPASTGRCVLPLPSCPPEVTSPDCSSDWQSECVECSVMTGGQRAGEVCGGVLALLCAITFVCCFVKPL